MTGNQRRYSRVSYHSVRGSPRPHHDETGIRSVCLSEHAGVRRSRINDDTDVLRSPESRSDLAIDRGHGLLGEHLAVLRVTGGQLWEQDIDRIELWDDMTDDQAGN